MMMDALEEIYFRVASVVIVAVVIHDFELGIIPGIIGAVVILTVNSVQARA
jgi:MFS superfamily sulfate permease-like transporter